MQRNHLSEIFVNLLTNARDAINGPGEIVVKAISLPDYTIEVSIRDDGRAFRPTK